MPLVRRLARPALAATFVTGGLRAVRHPDALAPDAEPVAARVSSLARRVLPAQVSSKVPTETVKLVRLNGAIQLAGGLLLATGRAPRLSAFALAATLVPTTAARYPFWSDSDPAVKAEDRTHFLQSVGLLGGLLLAAVDTAGKPGLTWRAERASRDVKRGAGRQGKQAKRTAKAARSQARTQARYAGAKARNTVHAATSAVADALPSS